MKIENIVSRMSDQQLDELEQIIRAEREYRDDCKEDEHAADPAIRAMWTQAPCTEDELPF